MKTIKQFLMKLQAFKKKNFLVDLENFSSSALAKIGHFLILWCKMCTKISKSYIFLDEVFKQLPPVQFSSKSNLSSGNLFINISFHFFSKLVAVDINIKQLIGYY